MLESGTKAIIVPLFSSILVNSGVLLTGRTFVITNIIVLFQTDPSQFGFKILNDVPISPTFRTIGDLEGLFPVVYADRWVPKATLLKVVVN